ncbi:putative hd domain-containing protein [Erysiphe necator]|uniref:5'-deoxynucleotidase n=1 Tax=Uncinula necator TaxID=52586 RepID=A0A0B1P8K3_UNCNE|nr:putative hd domain-containing protein [Erysiphe necator]
MNSSNERMAKSSGTSENSSQLIQTIKQNLAPSTARDTPSRWSVKDIASQLPSGAPIEGSKSPIPFFHLLERLKTTPREGWRRFGVKNAESISDHMYRMALMTMFAPQSLVGIIDIQRCTKMALIHDMAEALVGDITPVEGVSKSEKNWRESTTMDFLTKNILGNVDGGNVANDIRAIWQEYEDGETLESKFVHDIDKVELILQMVEYERAFDCKIDLGELTWVTCKILFPEIREWSHAILKEREELWAKQEHITYTSIGNPAVIEAEMLSKALKHRGESLAEKEPKANGHIEGLNTSPMTIS